MMSLNAFEVPNENSLDVVLVEDNRAAQSLIRPMLTGMRARRVRTFDRPELALKAMIGDPPEVVLSDWDVKPMMAERFVRLLRMKSFEPICFVPVIALTSSPTLRFIDRAMSAGANQILVKPFSPAALYQRLQVVLNDELGFELDGDQYVVRGVQELLEQRVRNDRITEMVKRAAAMEAVWNGQSSRAQNLVDGIISSEEDEAEATTQVDVLEPTETPEDSLNWYGWRI